MNADFGQAERNYRAALRREQEAQQTFAEAIESGLWLLATLTRDLDD